MINNKEKEDNSLLKIFSILDKKSEIWSRPIFMQKTGMMLRSFKDLANDKSHPIGQHPEDYYMYQIGTWNEHRGEIKSLDPFQPYGSALDYKDKELMPQNMQQKQKENK